jgi:uncharacterized membrane protein
MNAMIMDQLLIIGSTVIGACVGALLGYVAGSAMFG